MYGLHDFPAGDLNKRWQLRYVYPPHTTLVVDCETDKDFKKTTTNGLIGFDSELTRCNGKNNSKNVYFLPVNLWIDKKKKKRMKKKTGALLLQPTAELTVCVWPLLALKQQHYG